MRTFRLQMSEPLLGTISARQRMCTVSPSWPYAVSPGFRIRALRRICTLTGTERASANCSAYNGAIKKMRNLKGSSYEIDLAFIKLILCHCRTIIHLQFLGISQARRQSGWALFAESVILQPEYHMVIDLRTLKMLIIWQFFINKLQTF
jgi:hypothetical protein